MTKTVSDETKPLAATSNQAASGRDTTFSSRDNTISNTFTGTSEDTGLALCVASL